MKIVLAALLFVSTEAFAPTPRNTFKSSLNIVQGEETLASRVEQVNFIEFDEEFDKTVKAVFPDAVTNKQLETRVANILSDQGFTGSNTLLASSLCCDELARRLDYDFRVVYGNNFNLGGLSGFPFAGNTGFGAMSAHIPDDGYCLLLYGPHVGVAKDGTVGKVERPGIDLIDTCCGSAVAANNYLQGITDGGAPVSVDIKEFTDFQQNIVREFILPHGNRLAEAENRMVELPYALYDSQDMLMQDIVKAGAGGVKKGIAMLGGIQINTGPTTPDYFHPLRFELMNSNGEVVKNMLPGITRKMVSLETLSTELAELEADLDDPKKSSDTKAQMKKLSQSMTALVETMMKDSFD